MSRQLPTEEHRFRIRCGSCRPNRVLTEVWIGAGGIRLMTSEDVHVSNGIYATPWESRTREHLVISEASSLGGGWGTRFSFKCHPKKCGAAPVVTIETLLKKLEGAVATGASEVLIT